MTDDRTAAEAYRARVRGCLLGGAIGDALGGPVEFSSLAQILAEHPDGVRTFVDGGAGWPPGTITDDTQMTMFTAEGLIRAGVRRDRGLGLTVAVVHPSYDRWLDTQLLPGPPRPRRPAGSSGCPWLYARRAPGTTCLGALSDGRRPSASSGSSATAAENDSKGCGGVMRVGAVRARCRPSRPTPRGPSTPPRELPGTRTATPPGRSRPARWPC